MIPKDLQCILEDNYRSGYVQQLDNQLQLHKILGMDLGSVETCKLCYCRNHCWLDIPACILHMDCQNNLEDIYKLQFGLDFHIKHFDHKDPDSKDHRFQLVQVLEVWANIEWKDRL